MGSFTRRAIIVLLAVVAVGLLQRIQRHRATTDRVVSRNVDANGRGRVTLLSRTHLIDKIYPSMKGPYSNHAAMRLVDSAEPTLLWLTGVRSILVGADGCSPISREYFCHSNLTFTPGALTPRRTDGTFTPTASGRLFTLIPGRLDVTLPEGFGVPVYSDEPLDYFSMSLNMNLKEGSQRVRFKTAVDFVRDDAPAARDIKPLFRRCISSFEPIGASSPHSICHSTQHPGAACGPFMGEAASDSFTASLGRTNTIHWMIPPGRYESRVPVNNQLNLPYDTSAHYVTGHLHPYGKSLALVDATTGETLFTIRSEDFGDRLGVSKMESLSLPQGVKLTKGHDYELVTTYLNPTDKPIDAMSMLYVYMLDKQFRPEPANLNRAQPAMRVSMR